VLAHRRAQRELFIERYQFCTIAGRFADRADIVRGVRKIVRQFGTSATRAEIAEVVDDDAVMCPLKGMIPTRVCEAIFCELRWRRFDRHCQQK
jgi:hypothetical protein